MATINKDFKIKNGLVVEGSTATVNGNQVLTESASDQYIINLIGGETLVTSVNSTQLEVVEGELSVKSGVFDTSGAAAQALSDAEDYTDTKLVDYTKTADLDTTVGGYGYLKNADLPTMYGDSDVDAHLYGTGVVSYNNGQITVDIDSVGGVGSNENGLIVNRNIVDDWYDASGEASTVQGNLDTHTESTSAHGVTGNIVGTTDLQTISNKTIDGELSFGTSGSSVEDNAGNLTVYAGDFLYLTSNGGDIVLDADGSVYIGATTAGNEVATHSYVDNAVSGLAWKQAVNLKVDYNINVAGNQVGAVFDGHAALTTADAGYRFLVTDQNTASENGIWESFVDGSALYFRRPVDADAYTELVGAAVFIMEGTQYGSTSWVQGNHYLTDFTGQNWTQFSGQGSVTAGYGINVDGLEVSVDTDEIATQTDLSDGLGTKQDTLTAGNGIDIDGSSNISVDPYDLVGSGDIGKVDLDVKNGKFVIDKTTLTNYTDTLYDATGAASTAEDNANSYTDTKVLDYTKTVDLESTIDGYGFAYTSEIPGSTDSLTEGTSNLYYTDARAEDAAGYLLKNATLSNIAIDYDGDELTITAENGVAGSTTDDLTEGEGNLYFTDERAVSAIGGANIQPASIDINTYRREEATQQVVASASTVTAHTFTGNKSVKYLVRTVGNVSGTLHSQITELLVTVDGNNNVAVTEYGTIYTSENPLASATMDYSGGEYRLRVTTTISGAEVVAAATIMSWAD